MSDYPFPEIPDDEPDSGGGGSVTIDGQPISVDVNGGVTLDPGDIEIGAVEIKNGADDTRAVVTTGLPGVGDAGLVVRIAGGAAGGGLTNAELRATPVPVSGAVTVSDGSGPLTVDGTVAVTGSVAVTGPLTDAQLRATPVPVSGTVTTGGLTDTQLRATPVPISGAVTVSDGSGPLTVDGTVAVSGSVAVTGPLTDVQLRATPVPISGTVTATTGGLTDIQLRATPVPISGTVTITDGSGPVTVDGTVAISGSVAVTGPLTDAQLRATPVPVSGTVTDAAAKAEDSASANADPGYPIFAVRRDVAANSVSTDGDYSTLSVDDTGYLRVALRAAKAEDSPSADGDLGLPILFVRRDTASSGVGTDGDYANPNVDSTGNIRTALTDARSSVSGALGSLNAAITLSGVNLGSVLFVWPTGGSLSGTVAFELSYDGGTTWVGVAGFNPSTSTSAAAALTTTAAGQIAIPVLGATNVRARVSVYSSGTVTAFLLGSQLPSVVDVASVGTVGAISNISAIVPGTAASNLGKAEDAAHSDGATGVEILARRADTEGVSSGTNGDYSTVDVDVNGRVRTVAGPNPVTATLANVAGSATSVTLIAANAARRGWVITNDSTQLLYVKFGTTASTTSYTYVIPAATASQIFSLEMPYGLSYQGDITGIMPSANGNARTTELVAA